MYMRCHSWGYKARDCKAWAECGICAGNPHKTEDDCPAKQGLVPKVPQLLHSLVPPVPASPVQVLDGKGGLFQQTPLHSASNSQLPEPYLRL